MICGRVTPGQRDMMKRRCLINANDYLSVYNWLIQNHPSYSNMKPPQTCPQPIFIGNMNETVNNTDVSNKLDEETEHTIEENKTSFAVRKDPSESTGPFQSEKQFILSKLKGDKPTLLFKNGDYIGGHKVNLVYLFPLNFP